MTLGHLKPTSTIEKNRTNNAKKNIKNETAMESCIMRKKKMKLVRRVAFHGQTITKTFVNF